MRWLLVLGVLASAAILANAALSTRHGTPPSFAGMGQIAPGSTVRHEVSTSDGVDTWSSGTYTDVVGERCRQLDIPAGGISDTCIAPTKVFPAGEQLYVQIGSRQKTAPYAETQWDDIWVDGYASQQVARLQLVNTDCSVKDLPLTGDGAFLSVTGRDDIVRGIVPYKLVARDATGAVLEEKNVLQPLPPNGVKAGLTAPSPAASCA
ncbi:MAG TPA: hypothetical protein VFW41_07640 [Gaiellaceae bacterium]|nr:hypothetical protein [Gaiellaceae bacterium]